MVKNYFYSSLFFLSLAGLYPIYGSGIRFDHIIIYSLIFIYIFSFVYLNKKISFHLHHLNIIFLFVVIFFIGISSASLNISQNNNYQYTSQIENYVQPIAIIILTFFLVKIFSSKFNTNEFTLKIMNLFLIFMCVNTFLAVLMLYVGLGSYLNLIGGPPDEEGLNVISRSLPAGRSAGVFNQPIDGGVAYSIGMLIWFYLFDKSNSPYKLRFIIILPILIIGGVVSGSKVSQFLGIILSLIYLISLGNAAKFFLNFKIIIVFFFLLTLGFIGTQTWSGEVSMNKIYQYFIINRF
tara:strand:+ start:7461 stop:8342 length:882 start_codon:yes stop_codon:yes gene_type:complete